MEEAVYVGNVLREPKRTDFFLEPQSEFAQILHLRLERFYFLGYCSLNVEAVGTYRYEKASRLVEIYVPLLAVVSEP